MADSASIIQGILPNVTGAGILHGILMILIGLVISAILGYTYYWWNTNRKYDYKVTIFEKDSSGNTHENYDKAGIFVNRKTNIKLWFLKKLKKGLNPNEVPYVVAKNRKGKLIKHVYIERIGVSQYRFLHLKIEHDGLKLKVGEEDINWAVQDLEAAKKQYGKESFLDKYGSYIAFVITIMIVMIILISLFNKFEVLKDVATSLKTVADRQLEVTQALANVTKGNIFNTGQPIIVPGGK